MTNYTYTHTYSAVLVDEHINRITQIVIGLFISFAIIHAAFKTWREFSRDAHSTFNIRVVLWFMIYCIETIGNYLLFLITIACIYIFVVYKGQTVQHVLLPNEQKNEIIKISILIIFGAKIVEIIWLMCHYRRINIYFIDWEQPRTTVKSNVIPCSPHTSLKKFYRQKYNLHGELNNELNNELPSKYKCDNIQLRYQSDDINSEYNLPSQEFSSTNLNHNIFSSQSNITVNWSTSAWRTYFVANQWLEIKTKRKTSVIFQMIATLFIFEIFGLKFWSFGNVSKWTLTYEVSSQIKENFIFTNAIASGTFIFIYFLQWIACTLYEIYVKNYLRDFVDLCSIANISIFILSHNYFGYYIHGRSVHGFADKDLVSLANDLRNEENNECSHRGLIPGTHEQTFVVTLSESFRSYYNNILTSENNNSGKIFSRQYVSDTKAYIEKWKIRTKLHDFFRNHLNHCLKRVDYIVQEKCFFKKLCNIEITDTPEKSIFYIDKDYSFDQIIFRGNEWTLATFELITFLFILVLGGNWITCAAITIIISKFIVYIVHIDQKKQLIAKTFIDKRFLI